MKSPPTATAENPLKTVTRGEATACFQIALAARQDAEDARQFFLESLRLWPLLDAELIHPTRDHEHV